MWLSCCKCILISGIFFYVSLGFIILGQVQFLKFQPLDTSSSVGACFVSASIYFIFIVAILAYEKFSKIGPVNESNYYDLGTQRDTKWRQNGFRGADSPELKAIRKMYNSQMVRQQ